MRSLFLRLFLWFCISMILSGIASFLLFHNLMEDARRRGLKDGASSESASVLALARAGAAAAAAYESRGWKDPFPVRIAGSERTAYLFTVRGVALTGAPPPEVREAVADLLEAPPGAPLLHHERGAAVWVTGPGGASYIAAAGGFFPAPPAPQFRRVWWMPPDITLRVIISVIVAAAVSLVLAWRLTANLRTLREAANRLGAGELSARVEPACGSDEVSDLCRDFNRMAERLEALVGSQKQLLLDLSHELRSPLARLNLALGLAQRSASPETGVALERIQRESDRLNAMFSELLTLGLLETGQDSIPLEPLSLDELVSEVAQDADYEGDRKRRVVCSEAERMYVPGNRELLQRAVENVVRNALNYTAEGTTVAVTLLRQGDEAVLTVHDRGPGVPEASLGKIFQPFFRVSEARDRNSGGTGIGLSITNRAVAACGGSVVARNHPQGGLEVEIRLPLCAPPQGVAR